jgi:hypothetical protein
MSKEGRHHYIPIFYLKQWAGDDKRICEFGRPYDRAKPRRVHPAGTGYMDGLNTVEGQGVPFTRDDLGAAIMRGAVERVRPKMMTVIAIMADLLPIMWSTGSEVMQRIAVPMIGGMISSSLLTLVVIPAIYGLVKGWGLRGVSSEEAASAARIRG